MDEGGGRSIIEGSRKWHPKRLELQLPAAERMLYARLQTVYNTELSQYRRFLGEKARLWTKTISEPKPYIHNTSQSGNGFKLAGRHQAIRRPTAKRRTIILLMIEDLSQALSRGQKLKTVSSPTI
jgi:hypothetical protein